MIIFFDRRIWSMLLIVCLLCTNGNVLKGDTLSEHEILAKSCAVIDGYNGRVLYEKNAQVPMANASTTKIMTCILALEEGNVEDEVIASENACGQPKVHLGLTKGKTYKIKDLLYGLMLESFNDCAVAIAEYIAGTEEDFARMMNQKAKELGCTDTYFITPNGLDEEDASGQHHTTAVDLCKIMKYCVWESPCAKQFLEIAQAESYHCVDSVNQDHLFVNHNQLYLNDASAIAGKTGYTAKAGYCYVTAYEENGLRFCIALLGCGWPNHKNYKWIDSKKLIDYVKTDYKVGNLNVNMEDADSEVVVAGGYMESIDLDNWQKNIDLQGKCGLKKMEDKRYLYTANEEVEVTYSYDKIKLPLQKGSCIGSAFYNINDCKISETDIIIKENVWKWNYRRLFYAIFKDFF